MQRAALTSTGNICLRCSILSGRIGASSANRHSSGYEVPSWISHRTITAGSRLPQASSLLPISTEIGPTAFTGVKRSEDWEVGWFEGNIHQKAFVGMGIGTRGDTPASTSVRRGPYRGVAVKRVREVRMSRADEGGNGSWGEKNGVESAAVVAKSSGGGGKAIAKAKESSLEESSSPPNPTAAEGSPPEVDLPETTIRQPLDQNQREPPDERTVNFGKSNPHPPTPFPLPFPYKSILTSPASHPHPTTSPPHHALLPHLHPYLHPFPLHHPPPLPLLSPTPPFRPRPRCLQNCPLDLPLCMGPAPRPR